MSNENLTPDGGSVNTSSTVTDLGKARAKTFGAPKKKAENSVELRFLLSMLGNDNWRIAGGVDCPGLSEDESWDKAVFEWFDDGTMAYWRKRREEEIVADALNWIRAFAPNRFKDTVADSCVATMKSTVVGDRTRWLPRDYRRPEMSYLPLVGNYLALDKNGMAWALKPHANFGFTHCIRASLCPDGIKSDGSAPHGHKGVVGQYVPRELDESSEFGRFIYKIQPDKAMRERLQEALGSTLIEDNFQRALWLYGTGSNGKSTLLDILLKFHAQSYAAIDMKKLMSGNQFATSQLRNKTLALVSEAPKSALEDALFKQLVSQDVTRYELKGGEIGNFVPRSKWVLSINNFAIVNDSSHGFWRRVEIIPFETVLPNDAEAGNVSDFAKRIIASPAEMSLVLDWLLLGAMRLRERGGFGPTPERIQRLVEAWKCETDSAIAFFEDYSFQPFSDDLAVLEKDRVYDAYVERCHQDGKKPFAASQFWKRFGSWWGEKKFPAFGNGQRRVDGKVKRIVTGVIENGLGLSPGSLLAQKMLEQSSEEVPLPDIFKP